MTKATYKQIWGTQIGKDCINLDYSLAKWLGKRLVHLGTHTRSRPCCYEADDQAWNRDLLTHGVSLLRYCKCNDNRSSAEERADYNAAKKAMRFVAKHFGQLWD